MFYRWLLAFCIFGLGACSFDPSSFDGSEDAGNAPDSATDAQNIATNSVPNATTGNDGGTPNNLNNSTTDAGPPDAGDNEDAGSDAGADMGPPTCDGQVVNLETSNQHCGECGNACDPDYGQCRRGRCECVDPYQACGSDNACTDRLIDPANCGGCGIACDTGQICDNGGCVCLPGLTLCNSECVDTTRDPRHCGGCNTPCEGNACRDSMCRQGGGCGAFVFECPVDGGVQCVSSPSSPLNCDASVLDECGDVCEGTELCYRDDLIEPRRCRAYRPARGCVSCPCADCSDNGEECTELDAFPDKPVCVAPAP